ncbi:MAG: hypothetical protein J6S67_11235 [Methanobrevibacter sp.]|nr:hypothetical protein [Methanobrevibacter sp.]
MKEALESGATLEISVANVKLGWDLTVAVLRAFKSNGVDIELNLKKLSMKDIIEKNADKFIAGLIDVVCSDDVMNKILACGNTAIYTRNNVSQKVSMEIFEDEEARSDMIDVLYRIAIRNIKPFFPKALLK